MSYDEWKCAAPEDLHEEPPHPCCVCTGDRDAGPCSEECAELVAKAERRVRIKGFYIAARNAMGWARSYVKAGTTREDARISAIVEQVNRYRKEIAVLRRVA